MTTSQLIVRVAATLITISRIWSYCWSHHHLLGLSKCRSLKPLAKSKVGSRAASGLYWQDAGSGSDVACVQVRSSGGSSTLAEELVLSCGSLDHVPFLLFFLPITLYSVLLPYPITMEIPPSAVWVLVISEDSVYYKTGVCIPWSQYMYI